MPDMARLEADARSCLDPARFAYVTSASGDTAAANLAAWQQVRLRPMMLRDVRGGSTATTLLGQPYRTPIMIAPTAMHRLASDEGERATARGAAKAGAVYIVSAQATTSIEDIAGDVPTGSRWMQAYMMRDRGLTRAMLGRAAECGCSAVVLTVDAPGIPYAAPGASRRLNEGLALPNLLPGVDAPDVEAVAAAYAADLTFEDLRDVRSWTGLPLVVKGVLRADDAVRCIDEGADAIAVSNHGGRLVAGCVPTATALPEVVDAVDGRTEVYVDGGIRSGSDVLKSLALGARAVMVGRPVWWALAVGGDAGVCGLLENLRSDLERTMALCGVASLQDITRDLVSASQQRQSS